MTKEWSNDSIRILGLTDACRRSSPLAVVVPLTDAAGKSRDVLHVEVLRKEGGLSKDSIALCDQLKAVDQARIDEKLGNISADTMAKITLGIKRVLAL
ncbi:MAG: type II toxin-antitoxin system PemK/MazF family toxin [Ignavibacteriales bacterium]|nr:type II toxin-antitoxin system PemK/MazF family toxin [Ignavibacteriales bacterium]